MNGNLRLGKATVFAAVITLSTTALLVAKRSGPPTGYTGDFGELDCSSCHGNIIIGPSLYSVVLVPPPDYLPGKRHSLRLNIRNETGWWWGFQMTARSEKTGKQAGSFVADPPETRVQIGSNGVQYLSHASLKIGYGSVAWDLGWVAPEPAVGPVRFSVAAAFGWDIYYFNTALVRKTSATVPVSKQLSVQVLPQVVVGGGYTTTFTVTNTGDKTASGHIVMHSPAGGSFDAYFSPPEASDSGSGKGEPSSAYRVEIPAGGTVVAKAFRNDLRDAMPGWAQVMTLGGQVTGAVRYELAALGIVRAAVGATAGSPANSVVIPVDDDASAGRFTGYAVTNPGLEGISLKIHLLDASGQLVRTITFPRQLGSGEQYAGFLWQDLKDPALKFRGSMVIAADDGNEFSALALMQNHGLFSAIPVVPGKPPGVPK